MRLRLAFTSLLLPVVALATNSTAYIHDVEELLGSLESKDATRLPLTMKLADAYFNEALTLSAQSGEAKKIDQDRKKAILLYKESLSGLNGAFHAPAGTSANKIQFQLARLYADTGSAAAAEELYSKLSRQEALPDIQRESLLRLAEILESRSAHKDLQSAKLDYQKALELCSSQDVCSYCHYRLAWVNQRLSQDKEAIKEMELSLWDSKGHVREESLRDLVNFLGSQNDDGKESLGKVEKLASKLARPELVSDLSDSYLAQGHRAAGTYVLSFANSKRPNLKATLRLMEEYYGFRDWTKFEASLDSAVQLAGQGTHSDDVESEKILRRLTVQLDGERVTQPQRSAQFKSTVMLYLQLYPNNAERTHMVDGWIAAEKDENLKLAQLKIWIDQDQQFNLSQEVLRLHRLRAALAQKAQNHPVVIEEMTALASTTTKESEKREVQYQIAYAEYQSKNYSQALPQFRQLATLSAKTSPDQWAVQSQHLALDILAQNKDYSAVLAQVRTWTQNPGFSSWMKTSAFAKELGELKTIETSAEFEQASQQSQGDAVAKKLALSTFLADCEQKVLAPKSCLNAQVVAEKLGDEAALIRILAAQGKKEELATEFEASGDFSQAAELLEKNGGGKMLPVRTSLKIALLYELGGNLPQRNRILRGMLAGFKSAKNLGAEEDLILQTLKDSDLLTAKELSLPWKAENHSHLLEYIAERNPDAHLDSKLLAIRNDLGPAWEKAAAQELTRLDEQQKKIHFLGGSSKKKFENRVQALNALVKRGDGLMESSTPAFRASTATLIARSQNALAEEIKASPLPEGIDEAGKASLLTALGDMALPFATQAVKFTELATEQLAKVSDADERQSLSARLESKDSPFMSHDLASPAKKVVAENSSILKIATQELHQNPNSPNSLQQLKQHYEAMDNRRLAAYFQGRLQQLSEGVKK